MTKIFVRETVSQILSPPKFDIFLVFNSCAVWVLVRQVVYNVFLNQISSTALIVSNRDYTKTQQCFKTLCLRLSENYYFYLFDFNNDFDFCEEPYFCSKTKVLSEKLPPVNVESFLMWLSALKQICKILFSENC